MKSNPSAQWAKRTADWARVTGLIVLLFGLIALPGLSVKASPVDRPQPSAVQVKLYEKLSRDTPLDVGTAQDAIARKDRSGIRTALRHAPLRRGRKILRAEKLPPIIPANTLDAPGFNFC